PDVFLRNHLVQGGPGLREVDRAPGANLVVAHRRFQRVAPQAFLHLRHSPLVHHAKPAMLQARFQPGAATLLAERQRECASCLTCPPANEGFTTVIRSEILGTDHRRPLADGDVVAIEYVPQPAWVGSPALREPQVRPFTPSAPAFPLVPLL